MMNWQGPKRTALLVGAIALAILIGTGVVAAAQGHLAPLTSGNSTQAAAHGDQEPTETGQPEPGEDTTLIGTIQSIDTTGQAFVLAPDDGSAAVTIAFDARTNIDREDGDNGGNPFVVGAHVRVEVVKRADGSLYAREIKLNKSGQGDGDGNGQDGGSGDGNDGGSSGHDGSGSGGSGDNGSGS
jgi:hypothetical protein